MVCRMLPIVLLVVSAAGRQAVTLAPEGPFRISGNSIVDRRGRPFLIRGTALPELRAGTSLADGLFDPFSSTVLSVIRQRWNMNAVRLPVSLADFESDPAYLERIAEVLKRANRVELLVILAPGRGNQDAFWPRCAEFFRNSPQLIFELDSESVEEDIRAIRSAGANQPVIVRTSRRVQDLNAIYAITPSYVSSRTDDDRDHKFGELAASVPVMADDLDPALDRETEECASLPSDPAKAEALVQGNLAWFDAHQVSWIASEFRPGKLIEDYRGFMSRPNLNE